LSRCPVSLPSFLGGGEKSDKEKEKEKDVQSKPYSSSKKSSRKFPWIAFGGLTLVALAVILFSGLTVAMVIKFSSTIFYVLGLILKGVGSVLSIFPWVLKTFIWWPLKFIFSIASFGLSTYSPAKPILHCNNTMELQSWEVLALVPGSDGSPKPIKYQLNSPTPHAVSFVDIDYRDTRVDVFSNGEYYGSTSDFALDKSVYCGEDLNSCIAKGFSTGTVIIPGGKQSVEISWSGKDVFPGTDKIVWGGDRKRRLMWKKELCL
jgi:hypothetical protein